MSDNDKDKKEPDNTAEEEKIFKEHEPAGPDFSQASSRKDKEEPEDSAGLSDDDFEDFDDYQDDSALSGQDDFDDFEEWDDSTQNRNAEADQGYKSGDESNITGNIEDDFAEDPEAEDDFQKIVAEEQSQSFKRKGKSKLPTAAILAGVLILAGAGGFFVYTQNESAIPVPMQDDGPSLRQSAGRVAQSIPQMPDFELPGQSTDEVESVEGAGNRPAQDNPFADIPQPQPTRLSNSDAPLMPIEEQEVEPLTTTRPQVEIIDYEEMMRQRNASQNTVPSTTPSQQAAPSERKEANPSLSAKEPPAVSDTVIEVERNHVASSPESENDERDSEIAMQQDQRETPREEVRSSATVSPQRTEEQRRAQEERRAELARQQAVIEALNEKAASLARRGGLAPEAVARPIDSSASFFALSETATDAQSRVSTPDRTVEDFVRPQMQSVPQTNIVAGDMPESARRALAEQLNQRANASEFSGTKKVAGLQRLQPEETSSGFETAKRPNQAHIDKVLQHFSAASPAQALREVTSAIEEQPNNAMYHYSKGLLLDDLGEAAAAITAYEQALDLDVIYGTQGQLPREVVFDRLGVLRRSAQR